MPSLLTVDLKILEALDLGLLVHAPIEPKEPDWNRTVERWKAFAQPLRERGRQPLCVVWSGTGEGPNAKQRRVLDEVNATLRPRVAVVTASSVARGIVTAIAWFGHTEIRAFHPADLGGSLTYLGIPLAHADLVESSIEEVRARLMPSRTGT